MTRADKKIASVYRLQLTPSAVYTIMSSVDSPDVLDSQLATDEIEAMKFFFSEVEGKRNEIRQKRFMLQNFRKTSKAFLKLACALFPPSFDFVLEDWTRCYGSKLSYFLGN